MDAMDKHRNNKDMINIDKIHRKSKYKAVKTVVDGITFASKKEAKRYSELLILQRAKVISELELQPPFKVAVNGRHICTYKADFCYREKSGCYVVEDVKGVKTPVYSLKKKLVEAIYGIEIVEI